jgi:hypothetical protein
MGKQEKSATNCPKGRGAFAPSRGIESVGCRGFCTQNPCDAAICLPQNTTASVDPLCDHKSQGFEYRTRGTRRRNTTVLDAFSGSAPQECLASRPAGSMSGLNRIKTTRLPARGSGSTLHPGLNSVMPLRRCLHTSSPCYNASLSERCSVDFGDGGQRFRRRRSKKGSPNDLGEASARRRVTTPTHS